MSSEVFYFQEKGSKSEENNLSYSNSVAGACLGRIFKVVCDVCDLKSSCTEEALKFSARTIFQSRLIWLGSLGTCIGNDLLGGAVAFGVQNLLFWTGKLKVFKECS
jgi:hypothetical protein